MSEGTKAVFLSYASQDSEAARRIAEALRAAGVEVWFDQNELVGGDAWDAKIRKQIADCALFVPVISANTQARGEGYFRIEWRLAAQRTHAMADDTTFLLPVVIDATRDADARVPTEFRAVQWTRLPGGETPSVFVARVQKLLGGDVVGGALGPDGSGESERNAPPAAKPSRPWLIPALLGVAALGTVALWLPWKEPVAPGAATVAAKAAALTPAQELVAKARTILDQNDEMNRQGYALAEELLKKAQLLDPTDVSAWALHANLSANLVWFGFDHTPARQEAMRVQASRALTLAPNSDEARLAVIKVSIEMDQDQADSVRALQEIVRRSPDNFTAWRALGRCLRKQGDADAALAAMRRALELSANDPAMVSDLVNHLTNVGQFAEADRLIREQVPGSKPVRLLAHDLFMELYWRGNPQVASDRATRWPSWFMAEDRGAGHAALAALWNRDPGSAQKILARFPRDYLTDYLYTGPRSVLTAWANEQAGNAEAASADWKIALQVSERILGELPDDRGALYWKAWALARLGDRPGATAIVRLLEQREVRGNALFIFGGLAGLKAALGDVEAAVDLLAKIRVDLKLNIKPITRAFLTLNPVFDPLRNHPRFQALVAAAPDPEEKKEAGAASLIPTDKSVAVLAFANLSDDKANEYFSDGISEELLNVLAKVPGLKVTARTSAFHFKGKDTPIPEIARQLGVAYVVEGSVRKAGDKVRITAQLIKAADGFHVWSDTFTRDLKDIFAVQDEIAGLIAQSLQLKIGAWSHKADKSTDVIAWQAYLDGRRAWNLRTLEGYREAEAHLQRAIALDVRFARAYAALADVWQLRAIDESSETFSPEWRTAPTAINARSLIDQALEIDPNCPEAFASLGVNLQLGWQEEAADRAYQRAIELNPNYASAHQWHGLGMLGEGRIDEALAALKRAAELDPLSHRILSDYAFVLNVSGQPEPALALSVRALSLQPGAVQAVLQQARALALLRRPQEAIHLIEGLQAKKLSFRHGAEALAILAITGQAEAIRRFTEDSGAGSASMLKYFSLAAMGRTDEALANYSSRVVGNGFGLIEAAYGELFRPLRNDPRFQKLIEASGRAEYFRRAQAWRAAHPPDKPEARP